VVGHQLQLGTQRLRQCPPLVFPLPEHPELPFRQVTRCIVRSHSQPQPSHVRKWGKIQHRLTTRPDRRTDPASSAGSSTLRYLCPQLLMALPLPVEDGGHSQRHFGFEERTPGRERAPESRAVRSRGSTTRIGGEDRTRRRRQPRTGGQESESGKTTAASRRSHRTSRATAHSAGADPNAAAAPPAPCSPRAIRAAASRAATRRCWDVAAWNAGRCSVVRDALPCTAIVRDAACAPPARCGVALSGRPARLHAEPIVDGLTRTTRSARIARR